MGTYNHNIHRQIMLHNTVKDELEALRKDIIMVYHIQPEKDVSYSKVVACLMRAPASAIKGRASGMQEMITQIIKNGCATPLDTQVVSNAR